MGEDHTVEAFVNARNKQVLIGIANENGKGVYSEETHRFAWEALVGFAKQVIAVDRHVQGHLKLLEE